LRVSALAFGAGPVSGLMTGGDHAAQLETLKRAVARGVNWIDTAAGYGRGKSEANLGRALSEFDFEEALYVATKVRLGPADFGDDFAGTNYGNIIADCAEMQMGVFAIRVFAGGALLGQEPSAHTLKTPFFPLPLYERDRQRAGGADLKEAALRFVLDDARV